MSTRYISCARRGHRVGAQDKHCLVREVAVQSFFVIEEVGPVLLLQLRRARSDPQTLIASMESVAELRVPSARDLLEIRVFFQAEDGIRDYKVTGQTCALPI